MADTDIRLMVLEELLSCLDRGEAIQTVVRLGVPLHELEEHLDWLDQIRPVPKCSLPSTGRDSNGA